MPTRRRSNWGEHIGCGGNKRAGGQTSPDVAQARVGQEVSFLQTRLLQTPKRNSNVTLASINRSKRQDDG
eukprot:3932384-Prymnesium_polylepis.1